MNKAGMEKENKVIFCSNVLKIKKNYYLKVATELINYLNMTKSSNPILKREKGDYGPYVSFWNPAQQKRDKNGFDFFESNISQPSSTYYMKLPERLRRYLKIQKNSKPQMQNEYNKKGPYATFWNPAQQKKYEENKK